MKIKQSVYLFLGLALFLTAVLFVTVLRAGQAGSATEKAAAGKEYIITGWIDEEINTIISKMDFESFDKLQEEIAKSVGKEDISKEELILNYYGKKGWKLHSRYRDGQYIFER